MRGVHTVIATSMLALLTLLCALQVSIGLSVLGIVMGLCCGVIVSVLLAVGMRRSGRHHLTAADRITALRAVIGCGVAAVAGSAIELTTPSLGVAALAGCAIVLDGVDGHVARRTGSASTFGARFDQEVDAFLILVLSGYVASTTAWWVLAIGAARYVFLLAGVPYPWLRAIPPTRHWAKVVAVAQGVVLGVVAAQVLPRPVELAALALALVALAESFAHSSVALWQVAHAVPREQERQRAIASQTRGAHSVGSRADGRRRGASGPAIAGSRGG